MKDMGNILVVDDTPLNLKLLTEMLTKSGFKVRAAQDGIKALSMIEEALPELILLDIKMPDMDGYEVCRRLKENEVTASIPVIFISALNETEDIVKAFEAGGVDYVTKPFKFREVQARVESQLTLARQRKQIEDMREKDRQYFETLTKMKDQFIRAATHDLKNPVFIVVGYSTLLAELYGEDEAAMEYISGIRAGTNKMMNLITDLLDLAQMESGLELSLWETSLNHFLEECTQPFNVQADEKQINLSLTLVDPDVDVIMDPKRMEQVVTNLISNAIKYTPEGGQVDVAAEVEDDCILIHVADTGLGIPSEDVEQLFDAFYRVRRKQHMEVEGTGLGLSIVKAIVELHNGEIHVESQLGEGSRFTVLLPR